MKIFVFKGGLGDGNIRRVLGRRRTFLKKRTEIHFSILIENPNWDLKFVFQFDNENKKRKRL